MWGGAVQVTGQDLQNEITYSARDSIRYDLAQRTVYLFGAARVKYEDIELTADHIEYHFDNEEVRAFGVPDSANEVSGKPVFTQGGHTIGADSIRYSFRTQKGLIHEVRTQEQQTYVQARISKRKPTGEVDSKGGVLTTCDRPRPHYHFQVSRMIVLPDDKIIAGPAVMKVRKVPLPLAIPFGLFPNRSRGTTGVLLPAYGESEQLGFYLLNGGYYLPMGERADLQLTGDIYSKGSWALRALTRYKVRYRYSGQVDLSHSTLLNGDPEFPDFSRQRNYFLKWQHQMDAKASLTDRFSASVNVGTSQNFTNNFNSSTFDYLSNTFSSNIAYTHLWPGRPYSLSANLRHSQNTLNRTFDITIPALAFNLSRIYPVQMLRNTKVSRSRWYDQIGISYSANFDNRLSTTEDQLYLDNMPELTRQLRNGILHTAALTTSFKTKYFSINPEVRATDRMYFRQLRKTVISDADTTYAVTDTVPQFGAPFEWSMGATLTSKVYGMFRFHGRGLRAIRHVITPSAGVNFRPDQGTAIEGPFGNAGATSSYNPFSIGVYGAPSSGASGTVNLGLVQSLEAKVRDRKATEDAAAPFKKVPLLDFLGITSSYDWMKDSVNWSSVNIAARTALLKKLNVNLVSVWDPYAVDSLGRRIDKAQKDVNGALARLTSTNVALGFDLKSKRYGQAQGGDGDDHVVGDADPNKGARIDLQVPWRLSVNYSYALSRSYLEGGSQDNVSQSVLFNGDITVFKYWKLGASSGYDLVAGEWTPTTLNLYWDLHCWEFNFNIIPIGVRKSFSFRINVKASILRDLKLEQTRPLGNNNLLY
ncbi:MAG: LPS-assembly protein LptD [Flavobacteriales bacterium]|nr:LPS-assembly protein LptD [Flavobacteriales bacterium]MCB9166267.1 LPS-assembly protein LptD [Flavobacteriales bacterium]